MSKDYLKQFYAILEENTGISLDDSKKYLIESRLLTLSDSNGHSDVYSFISKLIKTPVGPLHWKAFEFLTTNETFFFRDKHVFDSIKNNILPKLISARRKEKTLRIWSSAVSSGQEAYSLAMLIRENFHELNDWNIVIQATDISTSSLKKAIGGVYSSSEARRGLDQYYLGKYFTKKVGDYYKINSLISSMVTFLPHNLVGIWPAYKKFDLIMIRNVLIYFNQNTKNKVLQKIHGQLDSDEGVLILGSSEFIQMNDMYKIVNLESNSYYKAV